MNQSLFPENNLLNFTKPSLVLFVEDSYNSELNNFIQSNHKLIVERFNSKDIDFCYLPYLLRNDSYLEVVSYNRPYLSTDFRDESIIEIYKKIKSQLSYSFVGAGLVFIENDFQTLFGFSLNDSIDLLNQFDKIIETYNSDKGLICYSYDIDYNLQEPTNPYNGIHFQIIRERDADSQFDKQAFILADEIREKIRQLKETGSLSLIGDILDEIQGATKKLSSLFITNDYRIFLKDYDMKEVVMSPLPKSVFILFLRHPEGIPFKQLADYHDELLSIYRNITVHENIDRIMESIRALTDPLNDSINEKCSRIRAAFLDVIVDDLAEHYYVTGMKGKPKKIILDRSLVEFQ